MIKACIFDLDGTLLNTLFTISSLANNALEKHGIEAIDPEEVKYMIGDGTKKLIGRMLERRNVDLDESFDDVYKSFMKEYDKGVTDGTRPYDGIPELLAELGTMGIEACVLSNKPDKAARETVKLFFGDLIDVTYGARDDVALKPDPEGLEKLFDEIGFSADECLYIGDTAVDMLTGKNGGCFTIGVTWGFRDKKELEENGADVIVDTPREILKYINR
ncbi:MAG: HAD family hydrolase [Clostridia bacterium]|nr:HAD family hydrolase [Clostridia bacterium]